MFSSNDHGFLGSRESVAGTKALNMINKNKQRLNYLELGVEQLLTRSRYSFSDDEKAILNDCLAIIRQKRKATIWGIILQVLAHLVEWLVSNPDTWNNLIN